MKQVVLDRTVGRKRLRDDMRARSLSARRSPSFAENVVRRELSLPERYKVSRRWFRTWTVKMRTALKGAAWCQVQVLLKPPTADDPANGIVAQRITAAGGRRAFNLTSMQR